MIKWRRLQKARSWKQGDTVFTSYGQDHQGGWWRVEAHIHGRMYDISQYRHGGPFRTKAEALRDSQIQIFGPQCEIADGGQWDPAWDRPQ